MRKKERKKEEEYTLKRKSFATMLDQVNYFIRSLNRTKKTIEGLGTVRHIENYVQKEIQRWTTIWNIKQDKGSERIQKVTKDLVAEDRDFPRKVLT